MIGKVLEAYISEGCFQTIAFQGGMGAWSHQACTEFMPKMIAQPFEDFSSVLDAVQNRKADLAMIPIENTLAGRVADVHALLPHYQLYIVGEYYLSVQHCLLGLPGTKVQDVTMAKSHIHALSQCRHQLKDLGIEAIVGTDTAMSAQEVSKIGNPQVAAIASPLAGKLYGLETIYEHISDDHHNNTTRFVIISREALQVEKLREESMTSLLFKTRNIPASLYKALGGFATNSVGLTRLESYLDSDMQAVEFFVDAEGHMGQKAFQNAMEELRYFSLDIKMLGSYERSPWRQRAPVVC